MSGVAGVLFHDIQPARDLGETLLRGLVRRGPDSAGRHQDERVLMVSSVMHTNESDIADRQPLVSEDTGVVITWDGRLDNREALALELQADHLLRADTEFVLQAYERWGLGAFAKLIGDWSAAVWDPRTREVILASDFMGTRPLYYFTTPTRAYWSSDLETLVRLKNTPDDLDPRFIAGFLILGPPPETTPYKGIASVPAGNVVRLSPPDVVKERFFSFAHGSIRYRKNEDYAAHMREVVSDAIKDRLRVRGAAWSELSGGWDSSVIVCVAANLVRQGLVEAKSLSTLSYFNPLGPESDESPFIEAVERHTGVQGHHFSIDPDDCLPIVDWVSPQFVHPVTIRGGEVVRQHNGHLVMTGRMGDSVMGSFADLSPALADYLYDRRYREYAVNVRRWSKATRSSIWRVARQSLNLLEPIGKQDQAYHAKMLRRAAGPDAAENDLRNGFCIHHALCTDASSIYPSLLDWLTDTSVPSKRIFIRPLVQYAAFRHLLYPDRWHYVEYTHPLTDWRVVRYVLEIPTDVLCAPGTPRALMRKAFEPLLPKRVGGRKSKGYAAPGVARMLRPVAMDWLQRPEQLQVVEQQLVDVDSLKRRLTQCIAGTMSFGHLLRMMALERWLEARQAPRDIEQDSKIASQHSTRKEVKPHALRNTAARAAG